MCGCSKRNNQQFVWTSEDGQTTMVYTTQIQAQAKVMRAGGTWEAKAPAPASA